MQGVFTLVENHQVIATFIGCGLFTAIVGGMPAPKPTSSTGYVWAYNALHAINGLIFRIPAVRDFMAQYMPQLKQESDPVPPPAGGGK